MTPETDAARHELMAFRQRRTVAGRFETYCARRSRHFATRQVITAVLFVLFTQITTLDVALLVLSLVVLADVLETSVLRRLSRQPPTAARLPSGLRLTGVLAAFQALSILCFVALLTTAGGEAARSLAVAICLAAVFDAALQLPLHRSASIARLAILLIGLTGLFVSAFIDLSGTNRAETDRLVFDAVAVGLLMAILCAIVTNINRARQRSAARQAVALEKTHELATTAAALADSRETAHRLAAVAERASDSIVVTDRDGTITWVNRAFSQTLGYAPDEVIGQDITMINGPETEPEAIDALLAARRAARPAQLQIQNRHKDGRTIWIETRLTPVFDEHGTPTAMIAVERNIEHIKAREAALAEASRVKQAFLATVSHELRTPMNGIIGNAELLLSTPLLPDQAAMVRTINDSGEALLTIVNDILDFSALEAGRLTISPAPFALDACVASVVQLLAPVARRSGIALRLHLPPDLPDQVLGDGGRLRQILSNLIGNAVKFTDTGSVDVMVSQVVGDDLIDLRFAVHDTGIGIAQERLAQIFESFTQADSGISGRFGGTGLGLAISRQLAEAMGGTLEATSTEGQGSVFTLSLTLPLVAAENPPSRSSPEDTEPPEMRAPSGSKAPAPPTALAPTMAQAAPPAARVPAANNDMPPFAGWRILIADDNATNRRLLGAMLKDTGADLCFASNGHEALAAFREEVPDAILMDMRMPELDGLAATRTIRAEERASGAAGVPIIALTANNLGEDRCACAAAGMTGFLSKPVRRKALVSALMEHVVDGAAPPTAAAGTGMS